MPDELNQTISNLEKKVNMFSKSDDKILQNTQNTILNVNSPILFYLIAPIILIIVFIISKPSFVTKSVLINDTYETKLDFFKIIVITLIVSVIINIVIYTKFLGK